MRLPVFRLFLSVPARRDDDVEHRRISIFDGAEAALDGRNERLRIFHLFPVTSCKLDDLFISWRRREIDHGQ